MTEFGDAGSKIERYSKSRASGGVVVHHAWGPLPGPGHEKTRKIKKNVRKNRQKLEKQYFSLFFAVFSSPRAP